MLNSRFSAEQAAHLAKRVLLEAAGAREPAVARAFALVLARPATPAELARSIRFLEAQAARHVQTGANDAAFEALVDLCQVLLNLNEFIYID
jgi:hypothetical protein